MGGGAKTVKADFLAVAGNLQRAPADQAGAQQRRIRDIVAAVGKPEYVTRIGDDMRGIAAVARIAGEQRMIAEIFPAFAAVAATAAGPAEPGNADAHAGRKRVNAGADGIDPADDFVARYDGQFRIWQFAIDDVQVGAAYPAGSDCAPSPHRRPAADRAAPQVEAERPSRSSTIACIAPTLPRPFHTRLPS